MKASSRYNVWSFCQVHKIVLDTKGDWRPLDANYTWYHVFFGDVREGITDGVVAWTCHADGRLCFVHLDMCKATPLPSGRVPASRPSKEPRVRVPREPAPRKVSVLDLLDAAGQPLY